MTTSLFILEHRPYDPQSDRWVVVSAGRTDRPWPGDEEPGEGVESDRRLGPVANVDETSPVSGYMTRPGNYLGLCSLAMPSGFSAGLPIGVQIVGKPYAEGTVLHLGKAYQDATDFHRQAHYAVVATLGASATPAA